MSEWPHPNLENLERTRTLLPEMAVGKEIAGYLASAARYVVDANNKANSASTRYLVAYAAGHALAVAALRANDYRTARERGHRRIVFETLPFSCGAAKADSLALVHSHEKRNAIDYAGDDVVSQREVEDLIAVVGRVRKLLDQWLAINRPELVQGHRR